MNITGPVGKEMLMPKDPNATVIMVLNINILNSVKNKTHFLILYAVMVV